MRRTPGITGYTVPDITSITYTNSDIDNLFQYFSCCFADKCYNYIKKDTKGIKNGCTQADIKYMLMGLDLLSRWYNAGFMPVSYTTTYSVYSGTSFSITAVPLLGNTVGTTIASASGYSNITELYNDLLATLLTGWTLTLSGTTFTITPPVTYTGNLCLYFDEASGGTQVQTWLNTYSVTPCNPLSVVQNVVEQMYKICGCLDCANYNQMVQDNLYLPLGQSFNIPAGTVLVVNNPIL